MASRKLSLLRGPVPYTRCLQCFTSGLAAFPLRPLPPEPPYTAIAFFKLSNTLTDTCMPHLNAGLAPTSLDHPHLRHNPRASSSLIDVHCLASLGGCYQCLSSFNMRFCYTENRDHSITTMTMPLSTKKITDGTNDLANTPTDAGKNLSAHSTLNDGSQNARPSLKFNILLDNSTPACWRVEGWMFRFGFGFRRTARVDFDVEPVSEHVLMLKPNAPRSPSSTLHVQLSYDSSLAPSENTLDNPPWLRAI